MYTACGWYGMWHLAHLTSAVYPDSCTLTVTDSDQCCIPRWPYTHSNRQWPVLYTHTAVHSQCQTVTSAVYPDGSTLTVTDSDQCCILRQLYTHSARQWPVLYTQTAVHSQCQTVTSAVCPDSCTLTVSYSALQSAPTHEWSATLHSVGENPSAVPRPKGRCWETRYRLLSCLLRFPGPVCCSVLLWISGRRWSCWILVPMITSSLWN